MEEAESNRKEKQRRGFIIVRGRGSKTTNSLEDFQGV
jgi:hypothetical protein